MKVGSVRDPIVEPVCSERVVWNFLISMIGTAGLVKSAALPKVFRRNCKRMLLQQHG
jgi:hypothetical protein|tara:strand:+ start:275 stop:445 length:171 start_codon:yes stop_codon:yes gene_type:complete